MIRPAHCWGWSGTSKDGSMSRCEPSATARPLKPKPQPRSPDRRPCSRWTPASARHANSSDGPGESRAGPNLGSPSSSGLFRPCGSSCSRTSRPSRWPKTSRFRVARSDDLVRCSSIDFNLGRATGPNSESPAAEKKTPPGRALPGGDSFDSTRHEWRQLIVVATTFVVLSISAA